MNIQVKVAATRVAHSAPAPARKAGAISRFYIVDQVVAGILWMSLHLPRDVSRDELEELAHHLAARIRAGADEPSIEAELAQLHFEHFCRRADALVISCVVRRIANVVRRS